MRKKVLIVDDDALNRRLFKTILSSEGYDTVSIDRGGEAIGTAKIEAPDLILMDMCMPDLDGAKATELIKKDTRLAGIPVIAVTALSGEADAARARASGCDDCLKKPISVRGLLNSVGKHLN